MKRSHGRSVALLACVLALLASCRSRPKGRPSGPDATTLPISALADLELAVVSALSDVAPIRLARLVDAEASARLEALRLLAWAFDAWDGPPEAQVAPTKEQAVQAAMRLRSWKPEDARRRMALLEKVARDLLLSHPGPLRDCVPARAQARGIGTLLGWEHLPPPAHGLAERLVGPYRAWAGVRISCLGAAFDLVFLYHRDRKEWVLAELAPETPAFRAWRFEPVPSPSPFGRSCSRSATDLFERTARALQEGDSRVLAGLWSLRIGAFLEVLDQAREAAKPTRDLPEVLQNIMEHWPAIRPWSTRAAWKRLQAVVHALRGGACRPGSPGADERQDLEGTLGLLLPKDQAAEPAAWIAGRIQALRSTRIQCGRHSLLATGAKLSKISGGSGPCWRLVRLEAVARRRLGRPSGRSGSRAGTGGLSPGAPILRREGSASGSDGGTGRARPPRRPGPGSRSTRTRQR